MNRFIELVLRRWMQRSKEQKIFLWYVCILTCLIFLFPLLRIRELDAVDARWVWFLWSGMLWLQIVVIWAIVKLIWLSISAKRKKTAYRIIGRNNNEHMDNATILAFLLFIMLTISETIWFYTQKISTVVTPTWTILGIELFLLFGIIRQLTLTRLQWKKTWPKKTWSSTTKVPYDVDVSKKEPIFSSTSHHQDKSLEGLFGKE
jgi:hypothetical protein